MLKFDDNKKVDYRSIENNTMSFVFRAPREPLARVDISNITENFYHAHPEASSNGQRARSFLKPSQAKRENRSTILTTTCDQDNSLLSQPVIQKWLLKDNSQHKSNRKPPKDANAKQSSMFRSSTVREILPQLSSIISNPGPGHYEPQDNRTLKVVSKKSPDESMSQEFQNSVCYHLNASYQAVPSIPDQSKKFGYTTEEKMLVLNMNPYVKYTGINEDRPGPGEYSYQMKRSLHGGDFHKSKVPRHIFHQPKDSLSEKENWTYVTETIDQEKYKPKQKANTTKRGCGKDEAKERLTACTQKQDRQDSETNSDEEEYIETTPGPGSYNYPTSSFSYKNFRSKKPAVQKIFISKEKKLKLPKLSQIVGPGSYDPNLSVNVVISNPPKSTGFMAIDPRFKPYEPEYSAEPASYKPRLSMENDLINRLVKGFKGRFGTNVERFDTKPSQVPGPGYYNISLTQQQKLKDQKCKLSNSYKSLVKRELFDTHIIKPGPGDYSIVPDPKAINQKQYEDLNPKKAPFNSTEKRAVFDPVHTSIPQQYRPEIKSPQKPPQNTSPFKSKTNRMDSIYQGQYPAVGQYYNSELDRKSWETPTFNILFRQL